MHIYKAYMYNLTDICHVHVFNLFITNSWQKFEINFSPLFLHQIENSQHRITMILKSLGIAIELCDISAPGMEVNFLFYSSKKILDTGLFWTFVQKVIGAIIRSKETSWEQMPPRKKTKGTCCRPKCSTGRNTVGWVLFWKGCGVGFSIHIKHVQLWEMLWDKLSMKVLSVLKKNNKKG